jgi:hypothetical protein
VTKGLLAKKCNKCGEWKGRSEFYVSAKSILSSYCKPCTRAESRARTAKLVARAAITSPEVKRCPACKETKPASAFNEARTNLSGLSCYCRECVGHREARRLSTRRRRDLAKLHTLQRQIAIALCRGLGIDLKKLAKEKYDAEFGSSPGKR